MVCTAQSLVKNVAESQIVEESQVEPHHHLNCFCQFSGVRSTWNWSSFLWFCSSTAADSRNAAPKGVVVVFVADAAAVPAIDVAPVLFVAAAETVVGETSSVASSAVAAAAVAPLVGTTAASSAASSPGFAFV